MKLNWTPRKWLVITAAVLSVGAAIFAFDYTEEVSEPQLGPGWECTKTIGIIMTCDPIDGVRKPDTTQSLRELPQAQLSVSTWRPFADIASDAAAIPRDVIEVCRRLVKRNEAVEGSGKLRGHFRLSGGLVDRTA